MCMYDRSIRTYIVMIVPDLSLTNKSGFGRYQGDDTDSRDRMVSGKWHKVSE